VGTQSNGGSASARDLLTRALSGSGTIVFEDASSRKDVVFCKVVSGKPDPQLAIDGEVHVVQIDFTDLS
jgi:tRNA pseudouridine-54 N-methylase